MFTKKKNYDRLQNTIKEINIGINIDYSWKKFNYDSFQRIKHVLKR